MTDAQDQALVAFRGWYDGLKRFSGIPAKGTLAGALVVLDRLKTDFNLDIEEHTAAGGSQIKGASGEAIRKLLADFGETRPFVSEGGRTNRGLRGDIKSLLDTLRAAEWDEINDDEHTEVLTAMQEELVDAVRGFHSRQRLRIGFDPNKSTWQLVQELLTAAAETGKGGPVAQYLVGAKLQLRFPDLVISNDTYSTADVQLGRQGDFLIGDTAFHVTVAPMPKLFTKCQANIRAGYRPFLIVSDAQVLGARQLVQSFDLAGRVPVESLESFIAQNLEELSGFARDQRAAAFRRLLDLYNRRVDAVEIDKSMLIDIPDNLARVTAAPVAT